jgi:hypothetical protein
VVVGDDDVQPEPIGVGDLFRRADATVHGDDDPCSLLGQLGQRFVVQAISLVAVGDVRPCAAAESAPHLDQERCSRDPVGVKVTVDGDRLASTQRLAQARDGLRHTCESEGVGRVLLAVEERDHLRRICQAAVIKYLNGDAMQMGKTSDLTGWGGWCDLPALLGV